MHAQNVPSSAYGHVDGSTPGPTVVSSGEPSGCVPGGFVADAPPSPLTALGPSLRPEHAPSARIESGTSDGIRSLDRMVSLPLGAQPDIGRTQILRYCTGMP